jgi:spore maturation protein CgeB
VSLKIILSHNKIGYEAEQWQRELRKASTKDYEFIPFDHSAHIEVARFYDAGGLDRAFRRRDRGLMRLQDEVTALIRDCRADVLLVTNCPPYHPDFLQRLPVYRALYTTDDPDSTYRRTIPYLHAYQHVFFCNPLHSASQDMKEKMRSCGMVNADFLPLGVFDYEFNPALTEEQLFGQERDIDVVYVGNCFPSKLPILARVQRAFGTRLVMRGFFRAIHNAYFIVRHGARTWVRSVSYQDRVKLYQRAKVGFNIHWDEFGLGNQRLYHLAANGVMQISDCADHVHRIYDVGREIDVYRGADDLIARIRHALMHEEERLAMTRAAYRRTMAEYRIADVTRRMATLIEAGMRRLSSAEAADA